MGWRFGLLSESCNFLHCSFDLTNEGPDGARGFSPSWHVAMGKRRGISLHPGQLGGKVVYHFSAGVATLDNSVIVGVHFAARE